MIGDRFVSASIPVLLVPSVIDAMVTLLVTAMYVGLVIDSLSVTTNGPRVPWLGSSYENPAVEPPDKLQAVPPRLAR